MVTDLTFSRERIHEIRLRLGLSQEGFARKLGVSLTAVGCWERGKYGPGSRRILAALLAAEREADGK